MPFKKEVNGRRKVSGGNHKKRGGYIEQRGATPNDLARKKRERRILKKGY